MFGPSCGYAKLATIRSVNIVGIRRWGSPSIGPALRSPEWGGPTLASRSFSKREGGPFQIILEAAMKRVAASADDWSIDGFCAPPKLAPPPERAAVLPASSLARRPRRAARNATSKNTRLAFRRALWRTMPPRRRAIRAT